jgi:hypothetical protein
MTATRVELEQVLKVATIGLQTGYCTSNRGQGIHWDGVT